jgi:cytochrome c oxidase subunit III
MSTVSPTTVSVTAHDAHGEHGDGHNPHLAHHFDTPEQQIASGKLGMWVFLGTEILMFGGLFCAYAVYRHNHPDVFDYAHQWLNKTLGAINTIVLITSSLTMAWGVRLAQLGKQRGLITCLILTIIGGYGFMGIKSIEYHTKWEHNLGFARANMYRPGAASTNDIPGGGEPATGHPDEHGAAGAAEGAKSEGAGHPAAAEGHSTAAPAAAAPAAESHNVGVAPTPAPAAESHNTGATAADVRVAAASAAPNPEYVDPNAGTPDAAVIRPVAQAPSGLASKVVEQHRQLTTEELEAEYDKLDRLDKERTFTFFQIYFLMTGLHGIHVLVGMALIFWILVRTVSPAHRRMVNCAGLASVGLFLIYLGLLVGSHWTWIIGLVILVAGAAGLFMSLSPRPALAGLPGAFGPDYFAPVDIVGLYWHLVDLIWIFLFPLLYLIH